MSKIEKIEQLLKGWKAAKEGFERGSNPWLTNRMAFKIEGVKAALAILKRPSNKKVEDLCAECGESLNIYDDYKKCTNNYCLAEYSRKT